MTNFFLFWRNHKKWVFQQFLEKNVVFWLWKPQFWDFVKIKKICHPICKISNNFCLAKYDLRWSWFFDFWVPFWEKGKNQALKKVIESKKVFSKSCWKFYILGGNFFLFRRNHKNESSSNFKKKTLFFGSGSCIFAISSK